MARGRDTARYKRLRARLRAEQRNCYICQQPIDYSLRGSHPWSFTVDHVLPLSKHPELSEDYSNFAAAHRACNSSKSDKLATSGLGNHQQQW